MGANSCLSHSVRAAGFNPRTRDGCEEFVYSQLDLHLVSIHAPVMGANHRLMYGLPCQCFNPRTRDGCEFTKELLL